MASKRRKRQVNLNPEPDGVYIYESGRCVWYPVETPVLNRDMGAPGPSHDHDHEKSSVSSAKSHTDPGPNDGMDHDISDTVLDPDEANCMSYITKKEKISTEWLSLRENLLNQLVKNAHPRTFVCYICTENQTDIVRCLDCGPQAYFCQECANSYHRITHMHKLEKWNPEMCCFEDFVVASPWIRPSGHLCQSSYVVFIVILDDKGRQHYQGLNVCRCEPLPVIFLEYGLWASTPSSPRVAFTLDFMRTLRAMVLEGQISIRAFITGMQECRSGIGRPAHRGWIDDLYRSISWESILNFCWVEHSFGTLQFTGLGFPDGSQCPVCPQKSDGVGRRIAMDGNMNLVRRAKSGHSVRAPIHEGRFFLPQNEVDQFVGHHSDTANPVDQNCSNFQAGSVLRAKNKTAKLDITGAFASVCNHDFPCKIFNMKHGERMAYPIFMMKNLENVDILMYDLGCLLSTVVKKKGISAGVTFAVPIFHVYGHKMTCQIQYSPRCTKGAGLFDGEGTERCWSYLGKFSKITKEMTPENRSDLIVESLLNYGQKITSKICQTLSDRLAKSLLIKDSTSKEMEEYLALLQGSTIGQVHDWCSEENKVALTHKQNHNDAWECTYALMLYQYHSLSVSEIDDALNTEDTEEQLARLDASLKRLEKQKKFKRWPLTSRIYKTSLAAGCTQKRQRKLEELRDAVVQYNYFVTMKSKYARGQSLAKRITRQILLSSKKLNKVINGYNSIPTYGSGPEPHHLQRSDVTALDADVWQHLSPLNSVSSDVPLPMKRKLIDNHRLHERAIEEIDLVKGDMERLHRSTVARVKQLSNAIDALKQQTDQTSIDKGTLSVVSRNLQETRKRLHAVETMIKKCTDRGCSNLEQFMHDLFSVNDIGTDGLSEIVVNIEAFVDNEEISSDDELE